MPDIAESIRQPVRKKTAPVIDNSSLFPEGAQTQIKRAYEFSESLEATE